MHDSEIKLFNIKVDVLTEINALNDHLNYHLINEAKKMSSLVRDNKNNTGELFLSKEDCDSLLNYLLSIERETLANLPNAQYLSGYYTKLEFNKLILNKL